MPDLSELGKGGIDSETFQLTSQSEHVTEGRKGGCLSSDIDLELVIGVSYTINSCDHC